MRQSVAEGGVLTYTVTLKDNSGNVVTSTSRQQCSGCCELERCSNSGVDTSALPSSDDDQWWQPAAPISR